MSLKVFRIELERPLIQRTRNPHACHQIQQKHCRGILFSSCEEDSAECYFRWQLYLMNITGTFTPLVRIEVKCYTNVVTVVANKI